MAKFNKGDKVLSKSRVHQGLDDTPFVYIIRDVHGGGWYKVSPADPWNWDLTYLGRANDFMPAD